MNTAYCKIFIIISILTMSISICYAGSVPEDLLSSDDAQIFFGEVIEYSSSTKEIKVKPLKSIKGNININKEQVYDRCTPVGKDGFEPEEGKIYLMTYYDNNNPFYIFRITSYETKNLKIQNISGMDMWERLQSYINDGRFEEAERIRLKKLGLEVKASMGDEVPDIKKRDYSIFLYVALGALVIISALVFVRTKMIKR